MAQNTVKSKELTLKDYYEAVPKKDMISFRDTVIKRCGISYPTFYKWIKNPQYVNIAHKDLIELIANEFSIKVD